ncbi:hypothetical protein BESB_014550 [Besnoitia besnoiti]|uniref:Transmembrane protein n=1 Tax=Besnoitia besnoiti TaxID=94643 RepID=A0A2A9MBS4_BESBE|nr:hypothetical protein BESB_014550 [Besnoitia besnoiti]PFH32842.1 hypothetical protein BESB_014550 [Besnoitia besnoiti]
MPRLPALLCFLLPLLQRQGVDFTSSSLSFSLLPSVGLVEATRARQRVGALVASPDDSLANEEDDEDSVLSEQDQDAEDECEAQAVMQSMLEDELSGASTNLMAASPQWKTLRENLRQHMDNKELCAPQTGTGPVCRQMKTLEDGSSEASATATSELKCGGSAYEKLIERYVHEKNCMAAIVFSHVLAQNWLGHLDASKATSGSEVERKGIIEVLVSNYKTAMDSGILDDQLWYVYKDAAQLLEEFRTAATDGLNAFNSEDVRAALLRRRSNQVAILCSAGNGNEAHLGANVIVNEGSVIFRVNLDGQDAATVEAFTAAINTFAQKFVQVVLEDGGLLDRAIDLHKQFYRFRFFKVQGLMQNAEPSTDVREQNKLMAALPLEKHKKKHKHNKKEDEELHESASFLQVQEIPQQIPFQQMPPQVAAVPTAAPIMPVTAPMTLPGAVQSSMAFVPEAAATLAAGVVSPLGVPTGDFDVNAAAAQAFAQPQDVAVPVVAQQPQLRSVLPVAPQPMPADFHPQEPQTMPGLAGPGPMPQTVGSQGPVNGVVAEQDVATPLGGLSPQLLQPVASAALAAPAVGVQQHEQEAPLSPVEAYERDAAKMQLPEAQDARLPSVASGASEHQADRADGDEPQKDTEEAHEARKGAHAAHKGELGALGIPGEMPEMPWRVQQMPKQTKAVPIKQKVTAIMSRLRMLKMQNETIAYEANTEEVERIVKAAYLDMTDRVFDVWGALLPQAAVTTTAQLLTLLLPKPDVDLAEFYNKTMGPDGTIVDGYHDQLPVNHTRLVERFGEYIEEVYRDCWRIFFSTNDNFLGSSKPVATPPVSEMVASNNSAISALELADMADAAVSAFTETASRHGSGNTKPLRPARVEHSFISTAASASKGIDLAVVDSSEGVPMSELSSVFTDEDKVQDMTVKALRSASSTVFTSFGAISCALLTAGATLLLTAFTA